MSATAILRRSRVGTGGTGFSDNFDRADSGTVGNGWTILSASGTAAIVSNQMKVVTSSSVFLIGHETGLSNGTFAVDIAGWPNGEAGMAVWVADANNWLYLLPMVYAEYRLVSCVAGAMTVEREVGHVFPSPPWTLTIVTSGNSITAKENGTDFLTSFALPGPVYAALGSNTKAALGAGYGASPNGSIYDNFSATP